MIRFIFVSLILFTMPFSLMADNKKEQQEQMRTIIQVLQKGGSPAQAEIPAFLSDDQKARDYCKTVLSRSDEAYAQDTAIANSMLCDAQWILSNMVFPDEKVKTKLVKQKYDPEKLDYIYAWADHFLQEVPTRHAILTTYCDKQLQQRKEAQQRAMPEGQLVSFSYREYGSSRPTTVEYALLRDADTGRWKLNGREVDETVATQIRSLVEQHKTYQCMNCYEEAPSFPQAAQPTGGLPSWEFICKFEGGAVVTGSECMPVPESCSAVVSYLRNLLK